MAIKNDALTLSYPPFHFFSSQLKAGSMPWWHYNIHLGFPLHADPGFPFWSPITWLFALAGSGIYVFSLLLLFYILVGGFGMIRLLRGFGLSSQAQFTGATIYVLSGFFVSHLEHPHYIFEVAFIPFCLHYFLRLCSDPGLKNGVQFGISLFFLVNSGYPSFTISAVFFFALLLALNLIFNKAIRRPQHLRFLALYMTFSILLAVVLCLPYLCSVAELYPRFNRGVALSEIKTTTGGFTLKSFISLFFPLASVLNPEFYKTDISWNNIFMGGIVIGLSVYGLFKVRHSAKLPLFIAGCLLLILSFQGLIKVFFFRYLPLFDHIHTNGGLRIYFILCMITIAMMAFDDIRSRNSIRVIRNIVLILLAVYAVAASWGYFAGGSPDYSDSLGLFLKSLSIKQAVLLQSIIFLAILCIALMLYRKLNWLWLFIYAELACAFLINLPYTGLSINRTSVVQQHLDSIRAVTTSRDSAIPLSYPGKDNFFRDTALFSPAIAVIQRGSYPSGLRSYFQFMSTGGGEVLRNINTVSCIHASHNSDHLHSSTVIPRGNSININGTIDTDDTLVITQNHYPGWNYHSSTGSGKPASAYGTFMAIPVKKGTVSAKLSYRPSGIVYCFVLSIFAWTFCCIILFKKNPVDVYRNS